MTGVRVSPRSLAVDRVDCLRWLTPKLLQASKLRLLSTANARRMNTHSIYPQIGNCAITRITIENKFRFWNKPEERAPARPNPFRRRVGPVRGTMAIHFATARVATGNLPRGECS